MAIGLAVAGSWITGEIDQFSDLDLVLVTSHPVTPDREKMLDYAATFGNLLNAFTGERRLLICLYDNPLLHVDIKFLTTHEFFSRVENPVVVWERDDILTQIMQHSQFSFPYPDFQWLEDRFWIWIHYAYLKIGRGELFEALDFTAFLRGTVIAPLLQIKNGNLPRALRKVETLLSPKDLGELQRTVATYQRKSIIQSIENLIQLYRELRPQVFPPEVTLRLQTEKRVLSYSEEIK